MYKDLNCSILGKLRQPSSFRCCGFLLSKGHYLLLLFTSVLLFSSCISTRTNVGNYDDRYDEFKYSQAKQSYLFWGLLPLRHAEVSTPSDAACQIHTHQNLGDCLLTGVTLGIYRRQTITVYANPQKFGTDELAGGDSLSSNKQVAQHKKTTPSKSKSSKTKSKQNKNKKKKNDYFYDEFYVLPSMGVGYCMESHKGAMELSLGAGYKFENGLSPSVSLTWNNPGWAEELKAYHPGQYFDNFYYTLWYKYHMSVGIMASIRYDFQRRFGSRDYPYVPYAKLSAGLQNRFAMALEVGLDFNQWDFGIKYVGCDNFYLNAVLFSVGYNINLGSSKKK